VPEPATYSTFTNSAGQIQDVNSALTPFHDDASEDFWTSGSVQSTETFGYAYPETADSTGTDITAQVVSAINNLYGPMAPSSAVTKRQGPLSWSFEPSLVGSHCIFTGRSPMMNCSSCNLDQLVTGTIFLTSALLERVATLDPEEVEPYLVQNFHYRISLMDKTEIRNRDIPSLKISIVSAEVQSPLSEQDMPKWGEMVSHMVVKNGGQLNCIPQD